MMRLFFYGLVLAFSANGLFADTVKDSEPSKEPLLVIWENPHYPRADDSDFLGGLVAVVWSDGRTIRAIDNKQVGHNYIEGQIRDKELKEFFLFLTSPRNLAVPDLDKVAPDAASRTFTIHIGDQKHKWTWGVPEEQPMLKDIETRMWHLPFEKTESVIMKNANLERFNPNKS